MLKNLLILLKCSVNIVYNHFHSYPHTLSAIHKNYNALKRQFQIYDKNGAYMWTNLWI